MICNCMLNLTVLFRHWIAFILCSINNIDHNSPHSIASTIVSTALVFQKKSHKFQVVIIPLLLRDDKHSRKRGIIITVNILLKFQCLNNGFNFLEFISNWLNNNDSQTWNSFTMMTFTWYGKAINYWQKKLLTFTIIRNTRWLIQNLHIGTLLLFI